MKVINHPQIGRKSLSHDYIIARDPVRLSFLTPEDQRDGAGPGTRVVLIATPSQELCRQKAIPN